MPNASMAALYGTYDDRLVALSIVLSVVASYAVLDLAGRTTSAHGWARVLWMSSGAVAMGMGIWATHYVGMIALSMPMPLAYHLPTVVLSLLAGIAASGVALFVVSQSKMTLLYEIFGSIVMGSGIAAMHYIGMAAMRCAAVIVYDYRIVALSIMLAIATSFVALRLTFRVRDERQTSQRKLVSALLMGIAISLMHYTGMWAATFRQSSAAPVLTNSISVSVLGLMAITATSFLVLIGAMAGSSFARFMAAQKDHLDHAREREMYFRAMADAVPDMLWTATPDGGLDFFNKKCFDYLRMTYDQLKGAGWATIVHPDDVEMCLKNWEIAVSTGLPYDVDYRLRGKDGTYRWFVCRANPINDSQGKTIKWFGTCTDIEDQKKSQQNLEQQILERTTQLADANTLLQEEMLEKDAARKRFDLHNQSMMKDLESRSEHATMLAKLGELLQSCMSRDEVIAAAMGYAPRIFPAARGAVTLLNNSRNLAEVSGSWNDCQIPATDFEPSECWALRTGHPHLVVAGDSTAPCAHAAGVAVSYLCIPILAQGETVGTLHLQATSGAAQFQPAEMSLKITFAGQVGLSIANINLREALRSQSVRDALTGLYNRRFLEEVLEREVRRAGRAAQSLGILMIDLDHFKTFNDTYGHDAGDAVLRETAACLLNGVRAEDFVCRFGGEEFIVILPTAEMQVSRARAERLRTRIRELQIVYQGKPLGMVTISAGVAVFPAHGTSPKQLMAAADAALYEAKRQGRDQVVMASAKAVELEAAGPA
jgi:diguanylate cyclase (GGDEF)-like protein/PAS domain S-box-containing protein